MDSAGSRQRQRPATRRTSRLLLIGAVLLGAVALVSLVGPLLWQVDPIKQDWARRIAPPAWTEGGSWAHPLGTDSLGRDTLSRLLHGGRLSLLIAVLSVTLSGSVGSMLGILAGYYGGWTETVVLRAVDIQQSLPGIVLAIVFVAVLGPSTRILVLVLVINGWPQYARVVFSSVRSVRERAYVEAAKALGARDPRLLWRQILPSVAAPLIILASLQGATMIQWEAALSYLGLGVPFPAPSWGNLIQEGQTLMIRTPWLALFPGLAIILFTWAANMLGEGFREILDPRLRKVQA